MRPLLFVLFLSVLGTIYSATGATLHVGNSQPYKTVSDAVSSAKSFDTVYIHPGVYKERRIILTKPLVLTGSHAAILDANNGHGSILIVRSDSVTISNLSFRNLLLSYVEDNAAVKIDNRKYVTIHGCEIIDAMFGIYLSKASHCRITNNLIKASKSVNESNSGNGIHCWTSTHLYIAGNRVSGHRDGLYFEFARHTYIRDNHSEKNIRYGLHFMFSDSCTYEHNTFINNGAGIAVMYTKNVLMANNIFQDNWGPSAYGLLLKDISKSHLTHNTFINNSIAIHSEGCTNILFENNHFEQNGYALRILGSSLDNTITRNEFVQNVFDVTTNTRVSANVFSHNYWSAYEGYDLNRDGIGDVPHHPVRLYALMVEQLPSSSILMNSALVHVLDLTERIVPTMTPQNLVDRAPLMHPPLSPNTANAK